MSTAIRGRAPIAPRPGAGGSHGRPDGAARQRRARGAPARPPVRRPPDRRRGGTTAVRDGPRRGRRRAMRSGSTSRGRHSVGADREEGGRRRPGRVARVSAYGVCGVVLLAGCASMPDSGDLRGVESTPRQDSQVRVFALPPARRRRAAGDRAGLPGSADQRRPGLRDRTQVPDRRARPRSGSRSGRPRSSPTGRTPATHRSAGGAARRRQVPVRADRRTGSPRSTRSTRTTPASGEYTQDRAPHAREGHPAVAHRRAAGRVWCMGKSDFQRNYMSVNKYYFASDRAVRWQPGTVADPVYVREQVDPVTQMVRDLLKGPTSWLDPVARTSFPSGTALKKGVRALTPDDQNRLIGAAEREGRPRLGQPLQGDGRATPLHASGLHAHRCGRGGAAGVDRRAVVRAPSRQRPTPSPRTAPARARRTSTSSTATTSSYGCPSGIR